MLLILEPVHSDEEKSIANTDNKPNCTCIKNIGDLDITCPTNVGVTDAPIQPEIVIPALILLLIMMWSSNHNIKLANNGP